LHVPQVIYEVGQDDGVKLFIQLLAVGISQAEGQVRMTHASLADHLGRKINPQAKRGFKGSQQVPLPATYFEHPLPRHDQETVDFSQALVIEATPARALLEMARYRIPMLNALVRKGFLGLQDKNLLF